MFKIFSYCALLWPISFPHKIHRLYSLLLLSARTLPPALIFKIGSYWRIIVMDLNASPLPEDDEQSFEEFVDDVQQPSESVQTMLRVNSFLHLVNCWFFNARWIMKQWIGISACRWAFRLYLYYYCYVYANVINCSLMTSCTRVSTLHSHRPNTFNMNVYMCISASW